ncbi:hypothetical protein F5141DRAFT_1187796 [Pisolithus sp. B1]|nr:hypothetical protein F5141DRAFT_1187796 [Pisolithus sp. B1]
MNTDTASSSSARACKRARNVLESAQDTNHNAHPTAEERAHPSSKKTHNKKQPLSLFPCQSCSKRGCAEICPDGVFILANTEQLHAKIIQMSDRIRQLEEALGSLQVKCAQEPHPLLHQDLLRIKNSLELYSPQTPTSRLSHIDSPQHPPANDRRRHSIPDTGLSRKSEEASSTGDIVLDDSYLCPEIEKLSRTFPYPCLPNNLMRESIHRMLPPREEAEHLCAQARLNALWQYNLDPSETWLPNLVHHVYTTPVRELSFRRLSLLFIMMAMGTLVDLNQQNDSPRAELYHRLARASLCEMNLMDEPSLDLLQTLFYMIWYLLIFSDKSQAVAYAWSIMGLAVKLMQSTVIPTRGKVIPEESQRRRMLLWELAQPGRAFGTQALSLGRPPSICLEHVDCRRPSYFGPEMHSVGGSQSYHEWKHGFFLECLTPVLDAAISAQHQPYLKILEVDKAVRSYPVPTTVSTNRQLGMQQVLVSSGREIVLLQLHRNFFTEALNTYDAFSYRHRLAPSVVATYLSATRLIATLKILEEREPQLSKRFMCFWFNAFSGAVALSLIVSRTPYLSLAPLALQELGTVYRLFAKVAQQCSKWRSVADVGCSSMEIDEEEKSPPSKVTQMLMNDGVASFDAAHPDLLRCLQDIERRPSTCDDPDIRSEQSTAGELSANMLALALGRDTDLGAVKHMSDSTTSGDGPQRVGTHTFNFDFGALASNVESQSNTYMSWF